MSTYRVFVRNWWKRNPAWPGGLEPDPRARKRYIARYITTEAEARAICARYNAIHKPGPLGRKAEYAVESEY